LWTKHVLHTVIVGGLGEEQQIHAHVPSGTDAAAVAVAVMVVPGVPKKNPPVGAVVVVEGVTEAVVGGKEKGEGVEVLGVAATVVEPKVKLVVG